MGAFDNFVVTLQDWGVVDVALPFLLVFTIVFAILEKTEILGHGKKNFNVMIGIVMGAAVVIPHVTSSYPISFDPVNIINGALPSVSILVVAIIMLLILIGVFAHDKVMLGMSMPGWVTILSIIAIVFIFGASAGWWGTGVGGSVSDFLGNDVITVLIMLLVFGLILSFITSDGHGTKEGTLKKIGIDTDKLFGGGGGHH